MAFIEAISDFKTMSSICFSTTDHSTLISLIFLASIFNEILEPPTFSYKDCFFYYDKFYL